MQLLLAFAIYVPALIAVPFLPQPRADGRVFLLLGALLIAAGFIVRLLALLEFRRHCVPLAPERWVPPQLVQTGIYRFVRHPMYVSDSLLFIGWCCAWGALYGLYLITPLFLIAAGLRGYLEERYLLEPTFGEAYREYRRRTGMFLPRGGKPQ